MVKQDYTCPYTGIRLVLGQNATLDHIIPKSKGGTNTLDNLQWVHEWINWMKHDSPHDVFVVKLDEFIQLVHEHRFCQSSVMVSTSSARTPRLLTNAMHPTARTEPGLSNCLPQWGQDPSRVKL
jgi:hypothetical protein